MLKSAGLFLKPRAFETFSVSRQPGLLMFSQPQSRFIFGLFKSFRERNNPKMPVELRNAEKIDVEGELRKIKEKNALDLNTKVHTINPNLDEFKTKEEYLGQLQKRRLEEERVYEERKSKHDYAQERLKRENEVLLKSIDYSSILIENINIGPSSSFSSLEELLLFIHSIRGKMTEENFYKCLEGFIFFGDHMNENDLTNPSFVKFLDLCPQQIPIIKDSQTIVMLVKFLDLYCLERDDLWIASEQRLMRIMEKLSPENLADMVVCFGNQAEGTEKMFDKFEVHLLPFLPKTTDLGLLTKVILGFFNRRVGTQKFFEVLFFRLSDLLEEKEGSHVSEKNMKDLARLALVIKSVSDKMASYSEKFYKQTEEAILKTASSVEFEHACVLAEGFGFENGSQKFIDFLEGAVLKKAENNEGSLNDINQLKGVLNGFILTYRASKPVIDLAKKASVRFKHLLSIEEKSQLVKAMWIMEVDDLAFYQEIEQTIVLDLKENSIEISNKELFDIALSYCVTRNGTRELYRLLEIILTPRLKEMGKEEPELLKKFHGVYTQSGMCTPTFISEMEEFMMYKTN